MKHCAPAFDEFNNDVCFVDSNSIVFILTATTSAFDPVDHLSWRYASFTWPAGCRLLLAFFHTPLPSLDLLCWSSPSPWVPIAPFFSLGDLMWTCHVKYHLQTRNTQMFISSPDLCLYFTASYPPVKSTPPLPHQRGDISKQQIWHWSPSIICFSHILLSLIPFFSHSSPLISQNKSSWLSPKIYPQSVYFSSSPQPTTTLPEWL